MSHSAHDAQSMLQQGAETLKHLPNEVANKAREYTEAAVERASHLVEASSEQVGDLGTAILKAVSKHPVQAACVALSVGCILGIIFARR